MQKIDTSFYSFRSKIAATLQLPDGASTKTPAPVIVQGPGWLGLRDAKLYEPYHAALLNAGFGVLVFDYRGFGDSEGDASYLDPRDQVEDWRSAATYLETRKDVDSNRLGAFGSGGTGGGNAIMAAALDSRFKAVVSQVPVADGRDWLHRMRREHEWLEFLERLRDDARVRVTGGAGEMVAPRDGIMVATPERKTTTVKADVDGRVPSQVMLASAEAILEYRPVDLVNQIAPRATMIICVENDATTPEDHAHSLYQMAGAPKRLIVQTGTTHYGAYAQYRDIVAPLIAEWFERHVTGGEIEVHESSIGRGITYLSHPSESTE